MANDVAVRNVGDVPAELSITDLTAQVRKIQEVMKAVMRVGEHYGVIPGTDKPTLLKPGAEKLCLTFRLDPEYETKEIMDGDHLTVISKCTLFHIASGQRMGSGMGSCSTKESRYAYRRGSRKCPKCNAETIIKGKAEYGGGWLCFKKKGGCGAKFGDGDATIESQSTDRVANDDKADQYNTILKMANKRSLVAAVLVVTAASDIFTQDIEDLPALAEEAAVPLTERRKVGKPVRAQDGVEVPTSDELRARRLAVFKRVSAVWPDDPGAALKKLTADLGHACAKLSDLTADDVARIEALDREGLLLAVEEPGPPPDDEEHLPEWTSAQDHKEPA